MDMKEFGKKLTKVAMIVMGAGLMMGNQKCQQQPPVEQRSLKKLVEMGSIRSSSILLPGGGSFDFQFVANQQVYGVLMDNNKFALRYAPPISMPPEFARDGDEGFFNLTAADGQMMKAFSMEAGKDNYSVQYSKTAWCMVNLPQAKISGAVNAFEMLGGGGVSLGFTPAGPVSSGLTSASMAVEWAQLDLSMMAIRPLTSSIMAASNVTSEQTKTKVSFGLNFGAFSIGPNAYYQTPLAQVTKKALTTAVDSLEEQLRSEDWYTRVLANHDTHLVIVGGADVNLEEGDQLLVYNEDYYWDGEPCNSRYLGGGAQAGSAVAKIEIDWVGDEIARGKVIEQNDHNAVIGAKVKLYKFHADDYVPPTPGVQGVQ